LGIRNFASSCRRLIKLIERPERRELWLSVKISLLGIGIIGIIAFVIKFIATILQTLG